MADPDALLEEFKAAYEAGGQPDLGEVLERASPEQRQTLQRRIDSYLMTAPRRAWNQAEYEASPARESVERVWQSLEGASGSWPELLPHLRHRARLKRRDLVSRLAAALDVGGREEKVAVYYNQMEHGRLPAEGISQRVFEALAEILGESAERIRNAGLGGRPPESGTQPALARLAFDESRAAPLPSELEAEAEAPGAEAGRDEVDELFLAG
jgi:hypothetical protein